MAVGGFRQPWHITAEITDNYSYEVETFSWSLSDNRVTINRSSVGMPLSFVVTISDSGRTMTWTEFSDLNSYLVLTRCD